MRKFLRCAPTTALLLSLAACGSWTTGVVHEAEAILDEFLPHETPADGGDQAHADVCVDPKAQVREWVRRLCDEVRWVPDVPSKKGGPRGSPGSFAKLSTAQVDEFVAAIIYAGDHFSPQSLPADQRRVLVAAEISIESAFTPGTSGVNPGDSSKVSVGPLQLTLPGMWDDIFRQYAKIPGLTHYDGSPWDPATTQRQQFESSIWDGIVSSFWCITEQGRRGCPEWLGGPDGPCPKTVKFAYLAWVIGSNAVREYQKDPSSPAADLSGQRDAYLASITTDLKLLGYDPALVDTAF